MTFTARRLATNTSIIPFLALSAFGAAHAQTAPTTKAVSQGEDIVVTGSLIKRPNNTAVSPIVSLSADAITQSGSPTLESALNQLPGFTPAGSAGTGGQGTGGHVTINLHGLGANRNLVLLDGKRLPLADIAGDVDINFIPEAIVGSVEAITGGASAVYGSDAMSGVVNFKTIPWFDGVKADVQYGNSFHNDYRNFSGSLAFGTKFGNDRGHFMIAGSYADRQGLSGAQRASFFGLQTPSSFIGQSTFVPSGNNLPTQAAVTSVFNSYGIATAPARTLNLGFNTDGTLFTQTGAVNYKGPTTGLWAIIGGNVRMPVGLQVQLLNPLSRNTVFSKFDYELTESVKAYGQFMYVDSTVNTASGNSLTQLNTLTTIPVTNPFIPTDLRTILASRANPTASFLWNTRYVGLPYKSWDEQYTVAQYLGGVKGELPLKNWNFDAFVSYDTTVHHQTNYNAVLKSQVQNLLNAADGGNSICAGGFNPFGLANATNISSACQAYMTTTAHSQESLSQTQAQVLVDGPLFKLPGGDAHLALLADYRRNTYSYSPDANLAAGNIEAVIASAAVPFQSIGVKEFAAQADLPIVKDVPFAKEFGFGGAFRVSDYTTSGSVSSYEGDVRWKPISQVLFRGSYQRAVRAPNIGELFSPVTGQQLAIGTPPGSIGDPCDSRSTARTGANGVQVATLCQAQGIPAALIGTYQFPTTAVGAFLSGNKGLTPEKATTFNVGVVLNPKLHASLLRDFTLSVDYYNISVSNVISPINGLTALSKCYNLDGTNPTYSASNPYCALISRDANGQLVSVATPYLNLGGLKTNGLDIQINWGMRLTDMGFHKLAGKVYISSNIGYTNSYKVQALPGSAFQEFSGTNTPGASYPRWKALTTFGYTSNTLGLGVRWHYQSAMNDVSSVLTPSSVSPGVGVYQLFDVFGTLKLNKAIELRAGINNVGDHSLPIVYSSQNHADPSAFDAVGRQFYVGAKLRF